MAIEYIVVQSGYAIFGDGETYSEAIEDASDNLRGEYGEKLTEGQVEDLLQPAHRHNDGDIIMLEYDDMGDAEDNEEFNSYMINSGEYDFVSGKWVRR